MNLLHTIGLMTRAEHEAVKLQAAADKQLIEKLTATARRLHNLLECRDAEIAALRPDAEAMRKKRDADRKRMAGKRNG